MKPAVLLVLLLVGCTAAESMDPLFRRSHRPTEEQAPFWIDQRPGDPPPHELVAMRNGLLHVPTRHLYPPNPRFFTLNALPFAYEARPEPALGWLQFMDALWRDDPESISCLQEWMGYLLTADTSLQKALLIQGPKRSGKGTIVRMLTELLGPANVCSPTLGSLQGTFGLAPLIGKRLAVIADARLSGRADQSAIAERLLSVSGEDAVTVDRKHREPVTVRLPTRIMILTNETPRLADASGACASRFVVLKLRESFYGREDPELTRKLIAELPSIFVWALDGLDRLRERGHFLQPASARAVVEELEDLASPVGTFVKECCEVGTGREIARGDLFAAYRNWCVDRGHQPGTEGTFGRNLRAAVAGLGDRQARVGGRPTRFYTGITIAPGVHLTDFPPLSLVEDEMEAA